MSSEYGRLITYHFLTLLSWGILFHWIKCSRIWTGKSIRTNFLWVPFFSQTSQSGFLIGHSSQFLSLTGVLIKRTHDTHDLITNAIILNYDRDSKYIHVIVHMFPRTAYKYIGEWTECTNPSKRWQALFLSLKWDFEMMRTLWRRQISITYKLQ